MTLKLRGHGPWQHLAGIFSTRDARLLRVQLIRGSRTDGLVTLRPRTPGGVVDDPFRMGILERIITSPNEVLVRLVGRRTPFPPIDVYNGSGAVVGRIPDPNVRGSTPASLQTASRNPLDTVGQTLISHTLATASGFRGGWATRTGSTTLVLYSRDLMSPELSVVEVARLSSLAHELFVHAYLAVQSAPSGHGDTILFAHNIMSPFEPLAFSGPVDVFSDEVIVRQVVPQPSPTILVSTDSALNSLNTFRTQGAAAGFANTAVRGAWQTLSKNYRLMCVVAINPSARDVPFGATMPLEPAHNTLGQRLLSALVQFDESLPTARRTEFRQFVHRWSAQLSNAGVFSVNRLADDMRARIPAS